MKTQNEIVTELKMEGFKVKASDAYGRNKIIMRKATSGRRDTLALFINIHGEVFIQHGKNILFGYTWTKIDNEKMKIIISNIKEWSN